MIIADNNIIIQCFKDERSLPQQELIAPDDLYDEYKVAEFNHNRYCLYTFIIYLSDKKIK